MHPLCIFYQVVKILPFGQIFCTILTSHLSIYSTKTILYPLPSLAFLLNSKEKRLCSWFVQLLFSFCSLGGGQGPAMGCTLVYIHSATHGIFRKSTTPPLTKSVYLCITTSKTKNKQQGSCTDGRLHRRRSKALERSLS
jgi:hypothetical protein